MRTAKWIATVNVVLISICLLSLSVLIMVSPEVKSDPLWARVGIIFAGISGIVVATCLTGFFLYHFWVDQK